MAAELVEKVMISICISAVIVACNKNVQPPVGGGQRDLPAPAKPKLEAVSFESHDDVDYEAQDDLEYDPAAPVDL